MKNVPFLFKYLLLFIGVLLPQVLLQNYNLVVVSWITIGVVFGVMHWFDNIFRKSLLIELPIIIVLFFVVTNDFNKQYLFDFLAENERPGFYLPFIVILFNCLNTAICIALGFYVGNLIRNKGQFGKPTAIDLNKGLPDKITFFNLFQNESKIFFPFLGIVGLINGVWMSALLILINTKITDTPLPFFNDYDWLIYLMLVAISFIIAASFQSFMIKLTHRFGAELRLSIFNKLRFTNFEEWIKLGEQQLRTALSDVTTLQRFPNFFLEGFNSLVMVVIGVGYLFYADSKGALLVLVIMVVLALVYLYRNKRIKRDLDEARTLLDVYHSYVIDFVRGFKELKMSIVANNNIFNKFLKENQIEFFNLQVSALVRNLENRLLGSYAWYIMIGIVLFVLPNFLNMTLEIAASFLITLLFLMGPVNALVGLMEYVIRMNVAIERLNNYNKIVTSTTKISAGYGDLTNINETFQSIRFENVTFEYFDEHNNSTFTLQPINLEIKKGEIIFVTGGNGSGKSTFINLLSGLYLPKSGNIFLNDVLINEDNLTFYRDQLSCIFTDNYLFTENYEDLDISPSNRVITELLKKMKIEDKIDMEEQSNKMFHDLSKGQQKRLALVYASMKNKEVFIFDEWAAEQDPEFRKYFYTTILTDFKNSGKTIIAVTHDDAYFNCAERIIKFDFGSVKSDERKEDTSHLETIQKKEKRIPRSAFKSYFY